MRPPDQDVRDHIIHARGVNFAVEAGAGTGKTTLLVDRVLHLLSTGQSLARLAVITFTRKAAADLEARLVRKLAEARESGLEWAGRALDELPRADIGTTDSFCRSILSDFALEAGVPIGFGLADEVAQEALRDVAWTRFLARSNDGDARCFAMLRELGIRPQRLRQTADALLEQRDLPLATSHAEEARGLLEIFRAGLAPALELRVRCNDPADLLFRHLNELARDAEIAKEVGAVAAERVILAWRRDKRKFRLAKGRKEAWRGAKDEVLAHLQALDDAVDAWRRTCGSARAAQAAAWLVRYGDEYAHLKQERGLVDFRDLALATRNLLRDQPVCRRRVAGRWDAIFLDEAQDTDPLQMEIALLLASDSGVADAFAAPLHPERLFLVGDPKQSIYRFRRADLELYARTRATIAASGESPAIYANFRSRPSILEFVNSLFTGWMQPEPGTTYQAPYVPLSPVTPEPEAAAGAARVSLLLPDPAVRGRVLARRDADKPNAEELKEIEIDAVVRLVRRGLGRDGGDTPWEIADPSTGEARRAQPGDVAILVRRTEWGDRLLDGLRRVGIPATSTGGRGFHLREEVRTLSLLLDAIVEPDDPKLFAALRSPALALTDDDLVLRFAQPREESRVPVSVLDAEARLKALAEHARQVSPADFLEHLAEQLALFPAFGFRPDGPARLENLRLVLEAAVPLADAGFDSLPEFARWLTARGADDSLALGELDPPGGDVVSILTIHKAKGLEFPVVILADLGGGTARPEPFVADRGTGVLEFDLGGGVKTPAYDEAQEREKKRRKAEEIRLLYVAATRARDHLVLSWPEGSAGFLHKDMLPARLGVQPGEAPASSSLVIVRAADLAPAGRTARVHVVDVEAALQESRADGHAADLFSAETPQGSYDTDGPRILPVSAFVEPVRMVSPAAPAPSAEAAAPSGRDLGSFVHAALEVWDPKAPFEAALERAASHAFRGAPPEMSSAERDAWRAELSRVARDPALVEIFRALAAARVRVFREVPFLLPIGDDVLSGTIDVIVEGAGGTLTIVDYKTERLGEGGAHLAATRHRRQASLYAYALTQTTRRPVTEVRLLFASTDPVTVVSIPADEELLLGARAILGNPEVRRRARGEARSAQALAVAASR